MMGNKINEQQMRFNDFGVRVASAVGLIGSNRDIRFVILAEKQT